MAGAAGGFVTRAFQSMLKESSAKKFTTLHASIQSYLDGIKEEKQLQPGSAHAAEATKSESKSDGAVDKEKVEPEESHASVETNHAGASVRANISIAAALSNAGHTLEEAQAELVLCPLRLAFETKNIKIVELALDCLHKLISYDHLEGDPGLEGGKNAVLFADILSMICSCIDNSSTDSTVLQALKVFLTAIASTKFRVHGEALLGVIRVCCNIAINSKKPINQATSKAMLTQMINIIFRRMEFDSNASHASKESQDHHSTGFVADTSSPTSNTEVSSVEDQNDTDTTLGDERSQNLLKNASLASLEELQNLASGGDIKGLEAMLDKAVHLKNGDKIKSGLDLESMSIGHHDALLLFRTLCKMGMKEDNDETTTKTRILSLELLQGVLEGVSHAFTKNFHFIDSVKAYLSYTLLRASVSSSPVIFQHAVGIFVALLLRFRESLKGETGIFFPLIVLRHMDNAECPANQRLSVLRMLEKICKDPQILVDIFVNYDCDLDAPNLFERMVTSLSRIAQGTLASDPNSAAASQSASIKGSSLQCLVDVFKSLVDWDKSHKESEKKINVENSLNERLRKDAVENEQRPETSSDVDETKAHKSTLEAAIAQLNRQPSEGVDYLMSNKLVESSSGSLAEFVKNTSNLDKTMIGDFLGQQEEFPLSIMHAYVDSMNFSGMTFAAAIREFLSGFRLPGEAQKIDRIMEKFAERYCADNPALFKNADTAYILAYTVIMLNTDAHNPTVTTKISKADFVSLNSTPDAEEAPPQELLEDIYDNIVKEEIKMNDDLTVNGKSETEENGHLVSILNLAIPRRKSSTETKSESDAIVKQIQAIFRKRGAKRGMFYTSQRVELIRPMIEAVGWPLLATFSVTMEEGDNMSRVQLCMEGFKSGIHITHVLGMDTMRYAFITSLVRFTYLHSPKEMRSKNVEALRTLLDLGESDSNALEYTWSVVLECVTRLEFITSSPAVSVTVMQASNQVSKDALLQSLRELAGKPAELVFLNSVRLHSDAVVEFFTALCSVSAEELKQNPARVYSLRKLVEISYYNMARIRMVWVRIWSVLSNHFVFAGSHHDEKVAMYAIDSSRQLGMKYLEHAELTHFTFQNDILKPFVVLMRTSQSESTRKLIVDSIVQMMKSKVGSIKSGWRSVFMIFTAASVDESEPIIESAFENVEQVILEHFDKIVGDCFMDCVNCLIGFAHNKSSHQISLKAVALLRICEDRLAEGLVPGGALKPIDVSPDDNVDVTEHYWFPMLAGLSDLTSDPRVEVRNCALEVLFDLLNERGSKFSPPFWESIFRRVLFPIFDHVRHPGNETSQIPSDDEWLHETCIHSLQLLCNLFNTFYKEVFFMLPPLLGLLLDCAKKTDQSVVSIALGALVHLIEAGGHQFSDHDWDTLLKSIRDASSTTQPLELLNELGFQHSNSPRSLRDSRLDTEGEGYMDSPGHESVNSRQFDGSEDLTTHHVDHIDSADLRQNSEISEGLPSPSQKPSESGELQRNQSLGQRIMGNVFLRNFTSKEKHQELDVPLQSQAQALEAMGFDSTEEVESQLLTAIRGKCVTQLLLLGAIDSIQKKYWPKLNAQQKITIMETLLSILEFSSSYNSYSNLRQRMQNIPTDRPPINLLRQEMAGTCVYLEVLQRTTSELEISKENNAALIDSPDSNTTPTNSDLSVVGYSSEENKLDQVAEEKLVSFFGQVLKEASEFQSTLGATNNMEIHRVLELRSPIIVKVIKGMAAMNSHIFRKHLREFYPLLAKMVRCDQMDIRRALAELFKCQLSFILP